VAFSPDGKHVLTGSYDNTAVLWETVTGRMVHDFRGHTNRVSAASFSPDGRHVLTGSLDNTAVLWEAAPAAKVRSFLGHTAPVKVASFSADGKHVFTRSEDGTTRLWDAPTGKDLARLLILDQGANWLACTPEGLFDGSPGGRNKVSYRVRNQIVPVDRFFTDFSRPGLLAALLKGQRPQPEIDFAALTPPKVRITSPQPGLVSNTPSVAVVVEAEDQGGGVQIPWLKHQGTSVAGTAPPERAGKIVRRRFLVNLVVGDNRLEGWSACQDGSWDSEPATLSVSYARPLPKPRLFLVAVGVSEYPDTALHLDFAARDAVVFADLFARRGPKLFRSVERSALTDKDATREQIREAFHRVAGTAEGQDVLVVLFAGHGAMNGKRYYFLPSDYRRGDRTQDEAIREQGLSADEIADLIMRVKATKRVLILDTCNAGGAEALFALRGRDEDPLRGEVERLNRTHGLAIIAAAPVGEEAKEPRELGHGILSYCLLAGLRSVKGGPLVDDLLTPGSGEGVADVTEWLTYAAGRSRRLMKKYYGRDQDSRHELPPMGFPILPIQD
jgi:hypothetical protein